MSGRFRPDLSRRVAERTDFGAFRIPLSRGLFALVDECDVPVATQYTWQARHVGADPGVDYAFTRVRAAGRQTEIYMHRLILPSPAGLEVDHINRNPLDNRRSNLRLATRAENSANRRRPVGRSGYIGVYEQRGRFIVRVKYGGTHEWVKSFETVEEAVRARDMKASEVFGEFAVLNFRGDARS